MVFYTEIEQLYLGKDASVIGMRAILLQVSDWMQFQEMKHLAM